VTRWRASSGALLFLALLALPLAAAPSEQDRADARQRFEQGIKLFRQGDHDGAIAQFTRAAELAPHAVIFYNLGLSFEALGRPVEAIDAMRRALAGPGTLSKQRIERAEKTIAEQSPLVAELEVVCGVAGATVRVQGIDRGKTPLPSPLRVKGGTLLVEVIAPAHLPSRQEVVVAGGQRKPVEVTLTANDAPLAHLMVKSKLPGAAVWVDGVKLATTPLASELVLAPGDHRVELRREGYRTTASSVTLGQASRGEITLEPEEDKVTIAEQGGTLSLELREPSSVVFIDGVSRGVDPDALRLAAGVHLLTIERDGFVPYTRRVTIPERGNERLRIALDPTPKTLADHRAKASALRIGGWVAVGIGSAASIASAILLGVTRRDADAANDAAAEITARCQTLTQANEQSCKADKAANDDLQASIDARNIAGYVGVGVGVAALGTGIGLLVAGPDPNKYDAPSSGESLALRLSTPTASPGFELALRGRF
jgi:hypothetical protein